PAGLYGMVCCSESGGVVFFSSRRRHTRSKRDWSSDVCSSDLFINFHRINPDKLTFKINQCSSTVTWVDCGIRLNHFRLPICTTILVKILRNRTLFAADNPLCYGRSEERRVGKE